MVKLIENEKPFWEPGKETGYHMMTTGWLIGELIRRVTGKSLGEFFNNELREPYGLIIGLVYLKTKIKELLRLFLSFLVLMINQAILQRLLEITEIRCKGFH